MAEITKLLHAAAHGDRDAEELLIEQIYGELHQLATRFPSAESPGHTLLPSALVNGSGLCKL